MGFNSEFKGLRLNKSFPRHFPLFKMQAAAFSQIRDDITWQNGVMPLSNVLPAT
jgi:hypothetical protein